MANAAYNLADIGTLSMGGKCRAAADPSAHRAVGLGVGKAGRPFSQRLAGGRLPSSGVH